jgi:hypothetical protein
MEIEGVVHNGVIVPDDATALPEGTRVRITPVLLEKPRSFGERFAQFKGAAAGLPADLATQHEHDRLGTPISVGKPPRNTPAATKVKSITVRLIGLMTLLWGGAYTAEGYRFLFVFFAEQGHDFAERIVIGRGVMYLALFGILLMALGIMALAAALALFSHRPWGRGLALTVAALAISLGLCLNDLVPSLRDNDATDTVWLAVAQVTYGILTFSILSKSRIEPVGIYILRLLSFLGGLPLTLFWGSLLPEFVPSFFSQVGTSRGDTADRFAALAVISGFVAGVLILATGVGLLIPRLKRFMTVVVLMIAACGAEAALAAFALLGALLGHSKGGLLEAFLLVFVLPFAVVWLILTASGVWYLRRLEIGRVLETERGQKQDGAE